MAFQSSFLAPLVLALGGLAFAQETGKVERVEPAESAPRGDVLEWSSEQGQEYWYRLPKMSRGRSKPSLTFMLHGTGLDHGWSFWNYPIGSGEFRGDDIVVSPDGLAPGSGDTFNFLQGKKDGDQIADLIELFRDRFDIGNVYLYGHSQGAFFCYWFAGEYPELVDGIVAHAGNVLDVKHSKLSRQKVAIGILHARADQVVSVECAERTRAIYESQGYEKLKCWIVEGLRDEAGHWPLPNHVATMFEWLDEVSTSDSGQALEVARAALSKPNPDYAVVARATQSGLSQLRSYKAEDAAEVAARLGELEQLLEAVLTAAMSHALSEAEAADDGKEPGPYAANLRWARRSLARVEGFEDACKPLSSLFKKHDRALAKLEKIKDKDGKKYAKAALKALDSGYLAVGWDELHGGLVRRVDQGWSPLEGLPAELEADRELAGFEPTAEFLESLGEALEGSLAAYPDLLVEEP